MLYPLSSMIFLLGWVACAASAAEEHADMKEVLHASQFQVFVENDFFAGSDQYYTNGLKVGGGAEIPFLGPLLRWMPDALITVLDAEGPKGERPISHLGFFIGQNLYTPKDISIADNQPYDRPWAAWLYLGTVVQRVRGDRLDTAELDLGVVGPAALGKPMQSSWHHLFGSAEPKGWHNQSHSEAAFMLAYLQKRRFGNSVFQIVPHAGVTVGTVMTLARAGGIVRLGHGMTGFGPDSIEPGGAMLQTTREEDRASASSCCEWYVFAGVDYRWVARNIFLDGPAFVDGPSVDRRRAVHDISVGLALRYRELNLSVTRIQRSEEFTTPLGGGGGQAFFSINAGWQFD